MGLKLMYITNKPEVAQIAQTAGVDRVWVDMEFINKDERQKGFDTVKSHHTVDDISKLRPILTSSELMVRVNPLHKGLDYYMDSDEEIRKVTDAGADVIMLPMFQTAHDADSFVKLVDERSKVVLLVETAKAYSNLDEILQVDGVDEIHIGLNDLHIAFGMKFMFELLSNGTVEKMCSKIDAKGLKYGFGGIATLEGGMLPGRQVIAEHYRLGSTRAILSRSFCNADIITNNDERISIFNAGMKKIRDYESWLGLQDQSFYEANKIDVISKVEQIKNNI